MFSFLHLILQKLPRSCLKKVAEYAFVVMPLASFYNQDYILSPMYQEFYASSVLQLNMYIVMRNLFLKISKVNTSDCLLVIKLVDYCGLL